MLTLRGHAGLVKNYTFWDNGRHEQRETSAPPPSAPPAPPPTPAAPGLASAAAAAAPAPAMVAPEGEIQKTIAVATF